MYRNVLNYTVGISKTFARWSFGYWIK